MQSLHSRQVRRLVPIATALTLAAVLAGCSSGTSSSGGAGSFGLLINDDNKVVQDALTKLSTDQCSAENKALPFKVDTVPQSGLDQQLQLLGGQSALPAQFAASGSPAVTQSLNKAGQTLDLKKALTEKAAIDNIEPAAISTIENLYGSFIVLPYQFNIEGVWYNKQVFADNGLKVPTTWDEMVSAADKLKASGVTAFSASGEQGWPITRLISGYLYRELGPDALKKVAEGKAKLTDPEYVKAAQAVADLGAAGLFGEGVGSIDYDTSVSQFLTGKAGMLYMGSWALGAFNDPKANQIGADNIGFFPIPEVTGGAGNANQIPANVGLPIAVSAKSYNDGVGNWLKCVSENYGTVSLSEQGTISGFKTKGEVKDLPPLTSLVQEKIASTTDPVLWFEALFGSKATLTSQQNAAPLVTGSLTAEAFMSKVQADLGAK
ncbi:extracellular solute-binding protein [Arthrobacter sp. ISL-69]|uniref:ABC transporter substrate-binding protein n=1 Tax=Arthrobacter sp. ISL-69 TaxID=2819113 RepID=UPI001BE6EC3E|nr:extracellular solute-binding protein [Arthrobacter sp. ISL-69]MBT2538705.1 extracellular solute-binding protein [Arthrobacter sp. ISL-69]